MRRIIFLALTALLPIISNAQEKDDWGCWSFVEVNHRFDRSNLFLTAYVECESQYFERFNFVYGRFSFGCQPLKWLKLGVNYLPQYEPGKWSHFMEADVVGSFSTNGFSMSLRERYRHGFASNSNELRSRLKLAYSIPDTKFSPYVAAEIFTWGATWMKTRHFLGGTYDILPFMQAEVYYMFYAFADRNPFHILGFGLNFNI